MARPYLAQPPSPEYPLAINPKFAIIRANCGRSSAVERHLPKVDVASSSLAARSVPNFTIERRAHRRSLFPLKQVFPDAVSHNIRDTSHRNTEHLSQLGL